ncbi:MAG: pyridoxal-phosphate dependent enzyme, partial [Terriglobales bacterium]
MSRESRKSESAATAIPTDLPTNTKFASRQNSFQATHSLDDVSSSVLGLTTLDRVGNTPLLRFERIACDLPGIGLFGKAEWFNPGGSVKDRAAARIISEGRRNGKFGPGKALLDSTSGNTGIAYAMFGAAE